MYATKHTECEVAMNSCRSVLLTVRDISIGGSNSYLVPSDAFPEDIRSRFLNGYDDERPIVLNGEHQGAQDPLYEFIRRELNTTPNIMKKGGCIAPMRIPRETGPIVIVEYWEDRDTRHGEREEDNDACLLVCYFHWPDREVRYRMIRVGDLPDDFQDRIRLEDKLGGTLDYVIDPYAEEKCKDPLVIYAMNHIIPRSSSARSPLCWVANRKEALHGVPLYRMEIAEISPRLTIVDDD